MEIGWIDYSEEERQRTLAVLSALQEPTTIDELGIGIVRDAFSDVFFPATSTLFTRARYLFFVPYILRDMEREDNTGKTAQQLRKAYDDRERDLAIALLKASPDDTTGIIGARSLRRDFSGHWVKRGPGVIYWSAVRRLGICKDPWLGYDECFRLMEGRSAPARRKTSVEDAANGWNDDDAALSSLWHVPEASYSAWKDSASIALTREEAAFLRSQLDLKFPGSIFSLIVRDPQAYAAVEASFSAGHGDDAPASSAAEAFPRFANAISGIVPRESAEMLEHAVSFSDFVYACRVRYNAQLPSTREEAESEWEEVSLVAPSFAKALDVGWIFGHLGILSRAGSGLLRRFLMEARDYMACGDTVGLDECIRARESSIKHGRSKIGRPECSPETWRGGRRLSYRFEIAASFAAEVWEAGAQDA